MAILDSGCPGRTDRTLWMGHDAGGREKYGGNDMPVISLVGPTLCGHVRVADDGRGPILQIHTEG